MVTFDTFLSAEESAAIVNKGAVHWGRSQAGDGVQAVRTSSTAWCEHTSSCGRDPAISAVRARIADLTGVPERNAEHLQVLKYEKGQFYRRHHDQNSPATSMWGPRTYTFFMYMNDADNAFPGRKDDPRDVPLQGGETHFPVLNKTISPRMGRALLWPSILDETPLVRDDRTDHEALTVVDGVKCAACAASPSAPFAALSSTSRALQVRRQLLAASVRLPGGEQARLRQPGGLRQLGHRSHGPAIIADGLESPWVHD